MVPCRAMALALLACGSWAVAASRPRTRDRHQARHFPFLPAALGERGAVVWNATVMELNTARSAAQSLAQEAERQLEYELHFANPTAPNGTAGAVLPGVMKVNKLILVILSAFLGCCGCDRCFLGAGLMGILKGLSCGGCGVLFAIDWLLIMVSALSRDTFINEFGMSAEFEEGSIQGAFIASIILVLLQVIGWYVRGQIAAMMTPTIVAGAAQGAPMMPTKLASALRGAGLLSKTPSPEEMVSVFKRMDKNADGFVDAAELQDHLKSIGVSDEAIEKMIKNADINGDGTIGQEEFMEHVADNTF